ncbi:MAG: ABC transporter permease [Hyphomicrobiales bacterium]|nr:MAG: ABC transporter permease [Hyphomicrobiales bacterium]
MDFLIALQGWIYKSLAAHVSAFAAAPDWAALAVVLPAGIAFGAIHALTPGHSKTVLASYLLGSQLAVLRGIAVAGALALTHVFSAVVIALTAAPLITRTIGGAGQAPMLEHISRGLLAAIGAWLLVRAWLGKSHQHGEGLTVGVVAGLVPCPLTLFVMFMALGRGVPEAGLTFAVAMMGGVALTLGGVALFTVLARRGMVNLATRYGASIGRLSHGLDAVAGTLLIAIGVSELLA